MAIKTGSAIKSAVVGLSLLFTAQTASGQNPDKNFGNNGWAGGAYSAKEQSSRILSGTELFSGQIMTGGSVTDSVGAEHSFVEFYDPDGKPVSTRQQIKDSLEKYQSLFAGGVEGVFETNARDIYIWGQGYSSADGYFFSVMGFDYQGIPLKTLGQNGTLKISVAEQLSVDVRNNYRLSAKRSFSVDPSSQSLWIATGLEHSAGVKSPILAVYKVNLTTGNIDRSFGIYGTAALQDFLKQSSGGAIKNFQLRNIASAADGSTYVSLEVDGEVAGTKQFAVVKLGVDGQIVPSFGKDGVLLVHPDAQSQQFGGDVIVLDNGNIVIAGLVKNGSDQSLLVAGYDSNGKALSGYGDSYKLPGAQAAYYQRAEIDQNGDIYFALCLGGLPSTSKGAFVTYRFMGATGERDATFVSYELTENGPSASDKGGKISDIVPIRTINVQAPGFVLVGEENKVNGKPITALLKIAARPSSTLSVQQAAEQDNGFKVYPNPAMSNGSVTADFLALQDGKQHILHMFNSLGQEVGAYDIGNGNNTIELTGLKSGAYYLRAEGDRTAHILMIR